MFASMAFTSLALMTLFVKRASRMRTGSGWLRSPPAPKVDARPRVELPRLGRRFRKP